MARISDDLIASIKQDVSLVDLVQAKGFTLKPHGKDLAMRCPFHEDDTASLIITPSKNLYHCFGCGAAGSVVDWVMATEGVSFRHAVELLKNEFLPLAARAADSDSSEPPKVVKQNSTPKLEAPLSTDADHQTALRQVIEYYHQTLKQSPEALDYLASRGLNHPELIERFKLGFANRTLAYRLPQKNRKEGAEIRGRLQEVGILRDTGHEHFNGSIVVPVLDENGLISEVYGRKLLGNRLRKGTAIHTYLPGPHRGVWNIEAFSASNEIILCEALIDAMTFWVNGFRNVTASYGTAGFTEDHLAAFQQHGIERVYIAYDRDEAGNTAADKVAQQLMAIGVDCYRVLFPKGMDANDYALQVTPAKKSLEIVVRKAEWMGNGVKPVRSEQENLPVDDALVIAAKRENAPSAIEPEALNEKSENLEKPAELSPLVAVAAKPTQPETNTDLVKDLDTEITGHEVVINLNNRRYRIRGLQKNLSYEQLKLNVLVSCGEHFHVDSFDIYSARHRQGFIKQAAVELGLTEDTLKQDLGRVLLKLEALQDQQIQTTLEQQDKAPTLSDEERDDALELLQSPDLLNHILDDFNAAGVVGEETNKLVGYLAGVSRKLDKPLAVIIQSSSAAGKSSLMDAVLAMMPEEEAVRYSAMSGQSLFYMGETNLKHKILAIAEEEGAESASYALKVLQSDGQLTMASTGKDPNTGKLVTQQYHVEGPVMIFLTTTAIEIDEELLNRCVVLTVNESREQTQAIHAIQRSRQTLEGLLADQDRKDIIQLHQNAQRLLRPLLVANPYAEQLTFLDDKTRNRRDHMKYLTLINTIALLHQYQRPIQTIKHKGKTLEYIEVLPSDIETANQLAGDVLGRTLDELPPQSRRLLMLIHDMVHQVCESQQLKQTDYRFTRKEVRSFTGWGNTQLKIHMKRLEDMEYVLVHRSGRGQAFVYELLFSQESMHGQHHLTGLIDPQTLQCDAKWSGQNKQRSGLGRPQVGGVSGVGHSAQSQSTQGAQAETDTVTQKDTSEAKKVNGASYHTDTFTPLVAKAAKAANPRSSRTPVVEG